MSTKNIEVLYVGCDCYTQKYFEQLELGQKEKYIEFYLNDLIKKFSPYFPWCGKKAERIK